MILETDLIVKDNNIYHIGVNKENVATTIILVGDQDRVPMISKYFDEITHKSQHREFVCHTGTYKGKRLTALSTGIGTDNIDIAVNELDAIFNVDLKTREINSEVVSLNLIRLGTCGTIREDIPVDSIIVSDYGLGFDNLLSFYKNGNKFYNDAYDHLVHRIINHSHYIVESDKDLANLFSEYTHGITATFPGFYAPQTRNLRIEVDYSKNSWNHDEKRSNTLIEDLLETKHRKTNSKVVNFEMETSALYGLAKLGGHKALTLCAVVANRPKGEFSKNPEIAVDNMIQIFLNKIVNYI
jgi:uridine phosphorylase